MLTVGPINAASPTPLDADGKLDRQSVRRLAKRWMDIGLDGVLILGSMGEGLRLPDAVCEEFLQLALEEAGGRLTIFAGAADLSRERMRARARRYSSLGADCVVVSLPTGTSPAKGIDDVKAVAEACTAPCGYYEVPAVTGTALSLHEILDVLAHPNVQVFKDSSNNVLISQAITAAEYAPAGVKLLDGVEYRTVFSRVLGYHGVLHGGAVLTGRRVRHIWTQALNSTAEALALDRENSLFLGTVYNRFHRPLENIAGQKYALKLLGVFDSERVVVDQFLSEASRQRIADAVVRDHLWLEAVSGAAAAVEGQTNSSAAMETAAQDP
jgi:dihydrodipicolinate synthase/N-acetylneuraminate lyase